MDALAYTLLFGALAAFALLIAAALFLAYAGNVDAPPVPRRVVWWSHVSVFFRNLPARPQQAMAWWLRRRGWVAFYLDERSRECRPSFNGQTPTCWLALYQDGIERERRPMSRSQWEGES